MKALVLVMLFEAVAVANPVHGTVVDDKGRPIAKATVTGCPTHVEMLGLVYMFEHAAGVTAAIAKGSGYEICTQTTTDAKGAWKLDVVSHIDAGVLVFAPGRAVVEKRVEHWDDPIAITMDPESPVTLDLTCDACGEIHVEVDYTPEPANFGIFGPWMPLRKPGRYQLLGLHAGQLTLVATARQPEERVGKVTLELKGTATTSKLALVRTGTGKSISGHLTYTEIKGRLLELRCGSEADPRTRPIAPDDRGNFVVADVPPGPCKVHVHTWDHEKDCSKDVTLQPGATNVELAICVRKEPRKP